MAPTLVPGEPKQSPKPEPIGNPLLVFLITTCTLCGLFLLWRRADMLRKVVSHRLKTFTRSEGRIRLSEDDGPSAAEFLGDDFDDDNEHIRVTDSDALSEQMKRATQAWREPNITRLLDSTTSPNPAPSQSSSRDTPISPSQPPNPTTAS